MFNIKKNIDLIRFSLLSIALCLSIQGCKTKSEFVKEPFGEYTSDAFFFRSVGMGEDKDMLRARSKAVHNAKVEIARNAQSVCQLIVLDYLDQTQNNNNINLKDRFISVSTESVSESLVNVDIENVVYKKDKNELYTCYAMVKVQKDNVFSTFANNSQEKMNLNAELFKQVVDKAVNQINCK